MVGLDKVGHQMIFLFCRAGVDRFIMARCQGLLHTCGEETGFAAISDRGKARRRMMVCQVAWSPEPGSTKYVGSENRGGRKDLHAGG